MPASSSPLSLASVAMSFSRVGHARMATLGKGEAAATNSGAGQVCVGVRVRGKRRDGKHRARMHTSKYGKCVDAGIGDASAEHACLQA